ncbi:MAG: serine hydrolase [Thermomicrobiales bacterium]
MRSTAWSTRARQTSISVSRSPKPTGFPARRHPAFAPGLQPTIYDLAMLMTIVSDNEATDILHQLVGVQRMHADLDELGLDRIRVPLTCRELSLDRRHGRHQPEPYLRDVPREIAQQRVRPAGTASAGPDEEDSGNDLTPPDQMAQLCEYIEQGVGPSDTAREWHPRHDETPDVELAHSGRRARRRHDRPQDRLLRGVRNDAVSSMPRSLTSSPSSRSTSRTKMPGCRR